MTAEPVKEKKSPIDILRGKVVPVAQMTDTGACMFIYSKGGAGKTTLAASAATNFGPVLYLDAEGGTKAITDTKNVEVLPVTTWREVQDFQKVIEQTPVEDIPWKTIVFDNVSEFSELAIRQIAGNDAATWPEYSELKRQLLAFVRFFRNLAARQGGPNIIFLCWDVNDKDDTGKMMYRLNFTPAVQKDLPGIVDIIGYIMPVDGDPDHRRISFEISTKTDAKLRRGMGKAAQSIPYQIYYGLDNLPLNDILQAIRSGVEFPKAKYPDRAAKASS